MCEVLFFFKEFSADFFGFSCEQSLDTCVAYPSVGHYWFYYKSHGGEHRSLIKTKESDEMTYNCERCCGGRAER